MQKTRVILPLLFIALLFTVGCKEKKRTDIIFGDKSYMVSLPSNWKELTNLHKTADVSVGNNGDEAYAVIIVEAKIPSEGIALGSYSSLTLDMLTRNMDEVKLKEPEDINITGYRAIRQEFTAKTNGAAVKYWHITLETNKNFVQMFLWSSEGRFEKNKDNFVRFMNSFNKA